MKLNPFNRLIATQTDLIDSGNQYTKQLKRVRVLAEAYKTEQEDISRILKLQNEAMRKSVVEGHTDHRKKLIERLDKEQALADKKLTASKLKYNKAQRKCDEIEAIYNKHIDRYGKQQVGVNLTFLVSIIIFMLALNTVLSQYFPAASTFINNIFTNIDDKFYEACFQLIIALTIGLYISTSRRSENKDTLWWNYSKFATGILWAVAGLILSMYVLAGGQATPASFIVVVASIVQLLYSALSPRAFLKKD